VYCIKEICKNNSLLSISNDGKCCSWSLENLNVPLEVYDIGISDNALRNIYPTCLDFLSKNEIHENDEENRSKNNYIEDSEPEVGLIGGEDGAIHSIKKQSKK
jgi:hypothetical protein